MRQRIEVPSGERELTLRDCCVSESLLSKLTGGTENLPIYRESVNLLDSHGDIRLVRRALGSGIVQLILDIPEKQKKSKLSNKKL